MGFRTWAIPVRLKSFMRFVNRPILQSAQSCAPVAPVRLPRKVRKITLYGQHAPRGPLQTVSEHCICESSWQKYVSERELTAENWYTAVVFLSGQQGSPTAMTPETFGEADEEEGDASDRDFHVSQEDENLMSSSSTETDSPDDLGGSRSESTESDRDGQGLHRTFVDQSGKTLMFLVWGGMNSFVVGCTSSLFLHVVCWPEPRLGLLWQD